MSNYYIISVCDVIYDSFARKVTLVFLGSVAKELNISQRVDSWDSESPLPRLVSAVYVWMGLVAIKLFLPLQRCWRYLRLYAAVNLAFKRYLRPKSEGRKKEGGRETLSDEGT